MFGPKSGPKFGAKSGPMFGRPPLPTRRCGIFDAKSAWWDRTGGVAPRQPLRQHAGK
jgi:hypothetical protein